MIELQSGKVQVTEVAEGAECGMKLSIPSQIRVNDTLTALIQEERKRPS